MMQQRLIMTRLILVLISVVLLGCGSEQLEATPEKAVQKAITKDASAHTVQTFQIHGTRPWHHPDRVAVLYSMHIPERGLMLPYYLFGYRLATRSGDGWQATWDDEFSFSRFTSSASEPLEQVDYARVAGDDYAAILGWARLPQATTVEVTFDNGQTLQDRITDTAFLVRAQQASAACIVRVLARDGHELARIFLQGAITSRRSQTGLVDSSKCQTLGR